MMGRWHGSLGQPTPEGLDQSIRECQTAIERLDHEINERKARKSAQLSQLKRLTAYRSLSVEERTG